MILGGTQVAVGALEGTYKFRDALANLLGHDGPFDSAKAKTTITHTKDGTTFTIRVTDIDTADPSVVGKPFGAHLHVGSCDSRASTGGHYKKDPTVEPALEANEVWFVIKPNEDGMAYDETSVDFVPEDRIGDGKMSIVIHVGAVDESSDKQACFPLDVPIEWTPEPSPSPSATG
jgi:hypothetical protein